ncbi:MAG: type II toxin-antitoxin system PrlF family antitoxin [Ktedonobacteraceae bacterium]
MREIISNISGKGQVTIPAEIRKHLGIKNHGKIAFVIDEKGNVRLKVPRYSDVDSLVGAAGSLSKPLSWKEMRRIAYEDRFSASYETEGSTS